ncbi:MAG: TonB family protein [Acidobacteria bacterium]|nr:TonB family protein [Acidobacteriota bacterium]
MAHVDILEQSESLRRPLVASAAAHAAFFASILIYSSMGHGRGIVWGDPHALGGGSSVGVTAVSQIPLPYRSGALNPLANDTQSRVPQPPKPEVKRAREPEPDAIAIRGRTKPQKKTWQAASSRQTYRSVAPARPNQLYSSVGQALSSPMYGAQSGTGGVGIGAGGAFGQRFGWYRDLLEQAVARKWHTDDVDARLQTAPPVVVTFELLKNGAIRDVRIVQSSGNLALDRSAQRAIYDANPFQPLPQGFDRNSAQIEFWFQLKR